MLPTMVTLPLTAEREDRAGEVIELRPQRVTFRYRAGDPFAIELVFATSANTSVTWVVSRELLAAALVLGPGQPEVGVGDVRIGPDVELSWRVWLHVCSPSGRAAFALRRADLDSALAKTEALVPSGTESQRIDWDREMALLGGDAA